MRDAPDDARVLHDAFADEAVTPRNRFFEQAVPVAQHERQTVDFFLHDKSCARVFALDPRHERFDVLPGKRILQRYDRHVVLHFAKAPLYAAADRRSRRVGPRELWILRFELPQLHGESIVLEVADPRIILFVVQFVMEKNLLVQFLHPLLYVHDGSTLRIGARSLASFFVPCSSKITVPVTNLAWLTIQPASTSCPASVFFSACFSRVARRLARGDT